MNAYRGPMASWVLVIALAMGPAKAQDDVSALAPSTGWVMDYADDACALRRTFGDTSNPVWLELRQFAPGDEFMVTVASASFGAQRRVPKSRFEPDGLLRTHPLAAYGSYGTDIRGLSFPDSLRPVMRDEAPENLLPWTDGERDAREKAVTSFYLEVSSGRAVQLQTGELHKPMTAMRTCLDDLLTHWGIDPEADRHLASRAKPKNQERWARPILERTPRGLVDLEGYSKVIFRLIIDTNGKPEACRVLRPVVDESYQETICGILMDRAEFEPAIDESGNPVKTYHLLNVVYVN